MAVAKTQNHAAGLKQPRGAHLPLVQPAVQTPQLPDGGGPTEQEHSFDPSPGALVQAEVLDGGAVALHKKRRSVSSNPAALLTRGFSGPELDLNRYEHALLTGTPLKDGDAPAVCVRILKSDHADFSDVSDNPDRKFVLMTGPADARSYPGKSGVQLLKAIGYDEDLIRQRAATHTFQLVAFASSSEGGAKPATWDNVFSMIQQSYGEDLWRRVAPHANALRSTSVTDIEAMACAQYGVAAFNLQRPPVDVRPQPLDSAALLALAAPTLVEVRRFLNDSLSLNRLFAGDGFTREQRADGSLVKGVEELILPAGPVEQHGLHVRFDLTLDLRELD